MWIIFEKLLFGIICCALLVLVAMHWKHWQATMLPGIQTVQVSGNFMHLDRVQIEQAVDQAVAGNFFDVDMGLLKRQLEGIEWIKQVGIERVWPHTLNVSIEERRARAQWEKGILIDREGMLFNVAPDDAPMTLPLIHGAETRQKFLLETYDWMNQRLHGLGISIQGMEESVRGTLYLELSDGLSIQLGSEHH